VPSPERDHPNAGRLRFLLNAASCSRRCQVLDGNGLVPAAQQSNKPKQRRMMANMRSTILAESQAIVRGCIFGEGQDDDSMSAHSNCV
jgi:uncharacterized protein (DUF2345 family)